MFTKICTFIGSLGHYIGLIVAAILIIVGAARQYIICRAASAGDFNQSYRIGFMVDWGVFCHWIDEVY